MRKRTTSTANLSGNAEPGELRRSTRLGAIAPLECESREKEQEPGVLFAAGASRGRAKPRHSSPFLGPPSKRKQGQDAPDPSIPAQGPLPMSRPRKTPYSASAPGLPPMKRPQKTPYSASAPGLPPMKRPRKTAFPKADSLREDMIAFQKPRHSSPFLGPPSKRKQGQDAPDPSIPAQGPPPAKRPRKSTQGSADGQPEETGPIFLPGPSGPISNRIKHKQRPHERFEPNEQPGAELSEDDSSLEEILVQPAAPVKGSFLRDFDHEVPQTIKDLCLQLLEKDQTVPQNTLFRDDLFSRLCGKIREGNEAMIIQDVTRLIVPSAMNLAIYGDTHLNILIESVNEAWTDCIPVEGPRPQPNYAVGFNRSAFTEEHLEKLGELTGGVFDTSFSAANRRMYFPFLTCEVKCGFGGLDIADRQNAHSMTIAVRSVVELYKAAKQEEALDCVILAFSVSHDHRSVRIYGHYPVIDGKEVSYHHHLIHEFSFTVLEGKNKWIAYKFIKNVYDVWMPDHLRRIHSAINRLPPSRDSLVREVQLQDLRSLCY
ncbi:hypothetical protein CLAIMM_02461 isoform 1 [Cladophialophora immunda]|nr:hypothetical protein CLAIMM_02461 isoform 1 [Cladophialophora immunda]